MSVDDGDAHGNEMTDGEIADALADIGYGTLSLQGESGPYAVPVSFGYDGDAVYTYLLRFGEESRKIDAAERSERACLTAFEVESRFDWRSVVVAGTLEEVDDAEYAEEVMDDNAWHPSLFASAATEPMTEVRRVRLRIDEASGRKGEEYLRK
ncbi:pyridoxamine 5'-phosphate oxidase family protein [Halobaculum sp. EA56]|uniref:pyridoxamine 5'-phosphate oxidase family protein n=1 Tax=Halobaculum sp. EA56 TaxID=3421648 RepID=UPI003EC02114